MFKVLTIAMSFLASSAFAGESGVYVHGKSAVTEKLASLLVREMNENEDHDVCYKGPYEEALENVHNSIAIMVLDVYGESEFPPLDVEIQNKKGTQLAAGIINPCVKK